MERNSSNIDTSGRNYTNATIYRYSISQYILDAVYAYCGMALIIMTVGIFLNLWFLVAIVRSQEMRCRLRNKVICNILVLHLVESVVFLPMNTARFLRILTGMGYVCHFYSVMSNLQLIQDFITNWLLVILIVIFIAQIKGIDLTLKFKPWIIKSATITLLVFPWVASLVVVPTIVKAFHMRYPRARQDCPVPVMDSMWVFRSIDTAVPIILAVILVIVAVCLKYRRLHRRSLYSMESELIGSGPELDNTFAYICAVLVSTACDLLSVLFLLNLIRLWRVYRINLYVTGMVLADSRVIFMTLPWLLLSDIRERIKTWRPWTRHAPGIDLAFTYKKDEP